MFVAGLAHSEAALVTVHACVLCHWYEPLMTLLVNSGWCVATADAAAAAADALVASIDGVARRVLESHGLRLKLRMPMLLQ